MAQNQTQSNVHIDQHGQVAYEVEQVMELLYEGFTNIEEVLITDEVEVKTYNTNNKKFSNQFAEIQQYQPINISVKEFDEQKTQTWFMPSSYMDMNIKSHVMSLCDDNEEQERVEHELAMYEERGLLDLLKYLRYLVDTMRQNNVMWGVGRGSSCASYVLFLIGIHRIDSIYYELDINDFLR